MNGTEDPSSFSLDAATPFATAKSSEDAASSFDLRPGGSTAGSGSIVVD